MGLGMGMAYGYCHGGFKIFFFDGRLFINIISKGRGL